MHEPRILVYIASSLDGFIAGPGDDLTWLDAPGGLGGGEPDPGALHYEPFMQGIGCMLMGRRTYDVVRGFDIPWPFADRTVLVATRRPLDEDAPAGVRAVSGAIEEVIREAKAAAGGKDVYLDGGDLIRQAAEAGLIDEITLTLAPVALGTGLPLFAGMRTRYPLEILSHHSFPGGMVQLRARPRR